MNLQLTMRPATQADEPFLMRLRKLTMSEHHARVGQAVDDAYHRQRIMAHFEAARIVCLNGLPIGLFKDCRDGDEWVLVQIQILPEHQGKGIGAHLIRALLEEARQAGRCVALDVLRGNPARGLYERLGFKETATAEYGATLVWRP